MSGASQCIICGDIFYDPPIGEGHQCPHEIKRADTPLPPALAMVLVNHGIPATVDALLAEFERRDAWITLARDPDDLRPDCLWSAEYDNDEIIGDPLRACGPTALLALAEAFRAMVGENQP